MKLTMSIAYYYNFCVLKRQYLQRGVLSLQQIVDSSDSNAFHTDGLCDF